MKRQFEEWVSEELKNGMRNRHAVLPSLPPAAKKPRTTKQRFSIKANKWDASFQSLGSYFERQHHEVAAQRSLISRSEALEESRRSGGAGNSRVVNLQAIFTRLRKTFASFQYVPTEQQRMLFDVAMVVAMRWIIGDQFELLKPKILEAINMDELFSSFHLVTPRQYGKSTAVAMTVLALALEVVGIRICIFSTGKRTAEALMTMIRQCLRSRPELASRIVKETNEELLISPVPLLNKNSYDLAKCSRIRCFPANANSKSQIP
jgi:hypothetical protein